MGDFIYQVLLLLSILAFTCFAELLAAFVMKIRGRKVWFLICFVNMLTNPLANLLYFYGCRMAEFLPGSVFFLLYDVVGLRPDEQLLILLEGLVVLCEAWIYSRFPEWVPHPFRYALAANLLSAFVGIHWVLDYLERYLYLILGSLS